MVFIKNCIRILLIIISVAFIVFGGSSFISLFNNDMNLNIIQNIIIFIFSIISFLIGGVGLFLIIALPKHCKNCKKWFAFTKRDTALTRMEKIYTVVENKVRPIYSRDVTEIREQHIPGTRKTYETTYKCKYCGAEKYKYKRFDSPNT